MAEVVLLGAAVLLALAALFLGWDDGGDRQPDEGGDVIG